MEAFSQFVSHVDSMIWSMVLVLLCLGVGLYLSIRMKFPQIRLLKEMVRLLGAKEESENGITPFQAFATTVGARVGMGNIAGVASAIYFGGPGSIFWMWIITLIGAASAYTESALGQAYKVKNPDGWACLLYRERLKMQALCYYFCYCGGSGTGLFDARSSDQFAGNGF